MTARNLASYIDHTLLKPGATAADISALCKEAASFGCCSVCVNGSWIELAKRELAGTPVKVCAVIGFPLGAMTTEAKVFETESCLKLGADEIDMVMNIGRLKSGDSKFVLAEIEAVQKEISKRGVQLKVIIETALLTDDEKRLACTLAVNAGAAFVKTCTGFAGGQATVSDIELMKQTVGEKALVKASGGIKDRAAAEALIAAGASRLGTSSAKTILFGGNPNAAQY